MISYSPRAEGLSAADLWRVWADVDRWSQWQDDIDFARLDGAFAKGSMFRLKPKGGPNVKIEILRCDPHRNFIDLTRFPLAHMYGSHDMIERDGYVELTTTVSIEGPLAFLWRRLVAQGVADSLPAQTRALVARAREIAAGRERARP